MRSTTNPGLSLSLSLTLSLSLSLILSLSNPHSNPHPRALLLENVTNLLRLDAGHTLHILLTSLAECGYSCCLNLINSAALVPQVFPP